MAAHRGAHLGQHAGHRQGPRRLPLALAALAAVLALCALCAATALPAAAVPGSSALVFTPLAARMTPAGLTITVSAMSGQVAGGTPVQVTWTTSAPAPDGGEFQVCLLASFPVAGARFGEKTVPATGDSSYSTWVFANVPMTGAWCRAYVAWRPTAGDGAWLSSGTSSGSLSGPTGVGGVAVRQSNIGFLNAPSGVTTGEQGSTVAVEWASTWMYLPGGVGLGEFCILLRSSGGQLYTAKTLDALYSLTDLTGGFMSSTGTYSETVRLDVPPGAGYHVVVAWRPGLGSGFWGCWTVSENSYTVTALGIEVAQPTGSTSYAQGGSLPVSWTTSSAVAATGDFFVCVRSSGGLFYAARTVPADGDDEYSTTLTLDGVPAGGGYTAVVGWRPTAGIGLPVSWGGSSGSFSVDLGPTADLTGLALSGSPADYAFVPATYEYSGITVPHSISSVAVTPTGSGAITVDGSPVTSGHASGAIALEEAGSPTTITVTSQETGKTAKTYTLEVTRNKEAPATPTFSPAAGAVTDNKDVTITSEGAGRIHYTTDGTTPTRSSSVYTGPVAVSPPMTLRALAVKRGHDDSAVGSATYALTPTRDLTGLTLSGKPAHYSFAGSTYVYTGVTVPHAVAKVRVTPTGAGSITVNGSKVKSGRTSGSIALAEGTPTTITVVAKESRKGAKTYTIAVTREAGPSPAKDITAFGFASPAVSGVIDQTKATIAVGVPWGIDVAHLAATFTTTGVSVGVGTTEQISGVTKNDFTDPVTYTVTAADGSTRSYVVTVTVTGELPAPTFSPLGGTVTPGTLVTISCPGADTIAYTLDGSIPTISADGASAQTGTKYTGPFAISWNGTAPLTIKAVGGKAGFDESSVAEATYAVVPFTITPRAGEGGTISPATSQRVQYGGSRTFTIAASDGYFIADVLVDGVSVGAVTKYAFQNVTASHTIAASFAVDMFTITPSAGEGGTISPDTAQAVPYGGSCQFTITAMQGCHVADVLVDGVSVGAATGHTFQNVTADHTIAASFASDVPPTIDSFAFDGLPPVVPGFIDEGSHTISLTVPHGTDVTGLVPTIAFTGWSISPQSGVSMDFTSPVHYIVRAGPSEADYTVTVTVAAEVAPGDPAFGGTVAYVLAPGDPGYSATVQHGVAVATENQSTGIVWALPDYQSVACPGALGMGIGDGAANTAAIITQNGSGTGYAAGVAQAYRGGGFADWYLPSKGELNQLFINRAVIGMTANRWYWSSSQSEFYPENAWGQVFPNGSQQPGEKSNHLPAVRAVRSF